MKTPNLHALAFARLEVTRDFILTMNDKCYMIVIAYNEFLERHPHLQKAVTDIVDGHPTVFLDITPMAVREFRIDGVYLKFKARYSGVEHDHSIHFGEIIGLNSPTAISPIYPIDVVGFICAGSDFQDRDPAPEPPAARAPFLKVVK